MYSNVNVAQLDLMACYNPRSEPVVWVDPSSGSSLDCRHDTIMASATTVYPPLPPF